MNHFKTYKTHQWSPELSEQLGYIFPNEVNIVPHPNRDFSSLRSTRFKSSIGDTICVVTGIIYWLLITFGGIIGLIYAIYDVFTSF